MDPTAIIVVGNSCPPWHHDPPGFCRGWMLLLIIWAIWVAWLRLMGHEGNRVPTLAEAGKVSSRNWIMARLWVRVTVCFPAQNSNTGTCHQLSTKCMCCIGQRREDQAKWSPIQMSRCRVVKQVACCSHLSHARCSLKMCIT